MVLWEESCRTSLTPSYKDNNLIIGEAEYQLQNQLKDVKKQYRDEYEIFKKTKNEVEYCTRMVDQSRQKLMTEFEAWFDNIYGDAVAADNVGQKGEVGAGYDDDHEVSMTISLYSDLVKDLMDVGEKFDKLQLERILKEDPESYAFYNARRNQERRLQKVC